MITRGAPPRAGQTPATLLASIPCPLYVNRPRNIEQNKNKVKAKIARPPYPAVASAEQESGEKRDQRQQPERLRSAWSEYQRWSCVRLRSPADSGAVAASALLTGRIIRTVQGVLASMSSAPKMYPTACVSIHATSPSKKPIVTSGG
jgi:hypothetical protein